MREGIFEFFNLNNMDNWGYSNTRLITRSIINAVIAFYCAKNRELLIEHTENCIKNNKNEKEILNILNK